jgi:hypothetical protein
VDKTLNKLSIFGFINAVYFLISAIIIHFIRSDLNFLLYPLSRYAIGDKSIILVIGFYGVGITEIITSLNLFKTGIYHFKISGTLLFLAGLGLITLAIFPMDIGDQKTACHLIHTIGALIQFICFPLSAFIFGLRVKTKWIQKYSVITGILSFSLFIMMCVLLLFRDKIPVYGLVQKINILIINTWLIFMSYRMIKPSFIYDRKAP